VIANVGFIGFALFLRVFHPTVGVQAIDSLTWESTDLTIAGTQQRSWPAKKRNESDPHRFGRGPYRQSHCAKPRKRRQILNSSKQSPHTPILSARPYATPLSRWDIPPRLSTSRLRDQPRCR
jgi:hypothetical protein